MTISKKEMSSLAENLPVSKKTEIEKPIGQLLLNKVPQITIFFWIIKIMATTVGETAADFLNDLCGLFDRVQKKTRNVIVIDGFDQKLDASLAKFARSVAQIVDRRRMKFLAVAATVMQRRSITLTPALRATLTAAWKAAT